MFQVSIVLDEKFYPCFDLFFRSKADGGEFFCSYMIPRVMDAVSVVLTKFTEEELFSLLPLLEFRKFGAYVCDRDVLLASLRYAMKDNNVLIERVQALSDMQIVALVLVCNGYWKGRRDVFVKPKLGKRIADFSMFRAYLDLVRGAVNGRHDCEDQGVTDQGRGTQEEVGAI